MNNTKNIIKPVYIPVSLFIFFRLFFLDATPRWDSAVYFKALIDSMANFDFTPASFQTFNWFGHPSMGFGLFFSIFQFVNPTNITSLNIGNLVLGIIAVLSFHSICAFFFGRSKQKEIVLLSSLFAVNPLFFGVSTAFVPDFGVLTFFLAATATFFNKKYLLSSFLFLFLIFSKETGAYCYTLFVFSYFLFSVLKKINFTYTNVWKIIMLILPGILYGVYLLLSKNKVWSGSGKNPLTFSTDCFFCFSFQPHHFIQNLWVIFILNFNWILSSIIIATLVKNLFHKNTIEPIDTTQNRDLFKSIIFVFIGFIIFFIFYVVYIIPSYMVPSIALLIIIFYYYLQQLISSQHVRVYILSSIAILFFIQTLSNIDFISSRIFGTFSFGSHQELKVGTEYTADGFIYNTQYLYIDQLINKFNREFKISNKDNILTNSHKWTNFYLGWEPYTYYIDRDSRRKTFSLSNSFRPNLYTLTDTQVLPQNAYYVAFPWLEDEKESLNKVSKIYKVNQKTIIKINGIWLNIYNLSKT